MPSLWSNSGSNKMVEYLSKSQLPQLTRGAEISGNYERNSRRSHGQTSNGPLSVGGQGARGHPKAPQAPLMTPTQSWRAPQGGWGKTRGDESNSGKKIDGLRKPLPIVLLPSLGLVSTVWAHGACASVFTRPLPVRPLTLVCLDRLFEIPAVLIYCCRV